MKVRLQRCEIRNQEFNIPYQVVDKENAVLHLRPDQETVFGVDGDHLSICQFSAPKGLDFEIVATSIAELCTEAIDQSKVRDTTHHRMAV